LTSEIKATRKDVRKFGILFAVVFGLIGLYMLWRGRGYWYYMPIVGGVFLAGGVFAYPFLRPVYMWWMKFAFVLAWINTRILLSVFFFLIVTPIGAGMRLVCRDLLDEKIEKNRSSYWSRREKKDFDKASYERLF
jgi:uncharacterized protein involved in cysteine biosynthesis